MNYTSSIFTKNVKKVFILPICIILIKISSLHVIIYYFICIHIKNLAIFIFEPLSLGSLSLHYPLYQKFWNNK
jgi:hypothetical protein